MVDTPLDDGLFERLKLVLQADEFADHGVSDEQHFAAGPLLLDARGRGPAEPQLNVVVEHAVHRAAHRPAHRPGQPAKALSQLLNHAFHERTP